MTDIHIRRQSDRAMTNELVLGAYFSETPSEESKEGIQEAVVDFLTKKYPEASYQIKTKDGSWLIVVTIWVSLEVCSWLLGKSLDKSWSIITSSSHISMGEQMEIESSKQIEIKEHNEFSITQGGESLPESIAASNNLNSVEKFEISKTSEAFLDFANHLKKKSGQEVRVTFGNYYSGRLISCCTSSENPDSIEIMQTRSTEEFDRYLEGLK